MRILSGFIIAAIVLMLLSFILPDMVAQLVYQLHDYVQTGKSNPQYKWVKVEQGGVSPSPTP